MSGFRIRCEEFRARGKELVEKIGDLIHEGNVRRIILRDEKGNTFLEIPLTIAAVGVIAAPVLAAIGGLAALASNFCIVVERSEAPPAESKEAVREEEVGASPS